MLVLCGSITSCFDLRTKRYNIDGPYFVEADPAEDFQTLYFDLGDGDAIGRVENVKRVGHTDKFIIAETIDGYYFINRQKTINF